MSEVVLHFMRYLAPYRTDYETVTAAVAAAEAMEWAGDGVAVSIERDGVDLTALFSGAGALSWAEIWDDLALRNSAEWAAERAQMRGMIAGLTEQRDQARAELRQRASQGRESSLG